MPEAPDAARRRAAWRFLGRAIRRQRFGVAGALAAGLTWQAAAVAAPFVAAHAIDRGIVGDSRTALYAWSAALFALGAVEAGAGAVRHLFAIGNRSRGEAAVRDAIFTHALGLDARFHDRVGPGDLMSRASNDAVLIARVLDSMGHTFGYLVTVLGAAAVMLTIDWRPALVVLAPLPLLSIGFWRYSSRYAERTRLLQEELARATTLVE